jgi:hypothetical protein
MSNDNPIIAELIQQYTALNEWVIAFWNNTLSAEIEQDLRSEENATSTGTLYDDLISLDSQYRAALYVFFQRGLTRDDDAPEMSDDEKREFIMLARSTLADTESGISFVTCVKFDMGPGDVIQGIW